MSGVKHLSMRVPWRDQPWDGRVCADPRGNSSCTLLANIGPKRDDVYEIANAGRPFDELDSARLPCLSERAAFLSPSGYTVTKTHPYAHNRALKPHLMPTDLLVPGYAFEAVPFRWLSRETYAGDDPDASGLERQAGYQPDLEAAVDNVLQYSGASWLMDSRNQRAAIAAFFEPVEIDQSLVFIYLKHSPLQEARTDRLLVGAARVSSVKQPGLWNHQGRAPFESLMWETIVEHSLRPDMSDGILLPYQQLIPLIDDGVDVDDALAWAPGGRGVEFSYVTEHVTDDAAIAALQSLEAAALGMGDLGVPVPAAGRAWVRAQIDRLWQARGPAPSLESALAVLGASEPAHAARAVIAAAGGGDPWVLLRPWLDGPPGTQLAGAEALGSLPPKIWSRLPEAKRDVVQLLSTFDISPRALRSLLAGEQLQVELTADELLENPYYATICTYGLPDPVPFATVDRALFPPPHVTWTPALPATVTLKDPDSEHRVEALLTDVVVRQSHAGDTVVPQAFALEDAATVVLHRPPPLSPMTLEALDLDAKTLAAQGDRWSPLTGSQLADGTWAYKLVDLEDTAHVIRDWILAQRARPALGGISNARAVIDAALARDVRAEDDTVDASEEAARTEKAAGLSVLHDSPLSVLLGGAGTGKTTLLRTLVEYPGVATTGVLLLAPTGKARVQLQRTVNREAQTIGSYLLSMGRYDGENGTYFVTGNPQKRRRVGLVVVDEASMLTEHMLAALLDSFEHVERLVLVGDPNQLPPIGAGRPFFDLVQELRPDSFASAEHVGDSFVELLVPRRQLPGGAAGRRLDLDLAAWFTGDRRGAGDDQVWHDVAANPDTPSLRYEPWSGRAAVEALNDILAEELGLAAAADPLVAFALSYGAEQNGDWTNWEPGAGDKAEAWQILSPTRSREFGTVEINRDIKARYRHADTSLAGRAAKSNIANPVGPERIVRGDKVMHTRNGKQPIYRERRSSYVANGEIGVGIGRRVSSSVLPKNKLTLQVEFSSQPGTVFSYWPSNTDDPRLELAWAVTVHKAQGSEFDTTFLLLPRRSNVSRELMYTALTRQRSRVVIVHDGELADLRELGQSWRSENAQRLTDLFRPPAPVELKVGGRVRRFDQNRIHIAANGTPMASKNEVIIAGLLDQLVPGQWEYEQRFQGSDGREVSPDFTIRSADGRLIFWEHAGMLDVPDYAEKWELKKAWYAANGVLPEAEGGGPIGTLMWTDDRGGVDAPAWLAYAAQVLGVTATTAAAPDAGPTPVRRPAAKKATGRRPI